MRCLVHKEVWLYEDMMEKNGYCPNCKKWYVLIMNCIMCGKELIKEQIEMYEEFCSQLCKIQSAFEGSKFKSSK